MRAGLGLDAHRFADVGPLVLGGVVVERERGLAATSDGDVLAHAVADALLGAAGLGDLGAHFPSSDPQWQGADSMAMLRSVVEMLAETRFVPEAADATVVSQSIRIAPYREQMRSALAGVLGVAVSQVSVKGTTTDGMGWIGADEGVAAYAVVTIRSPETG